MAENFSGLITIDTGAAEDVLIGQHPSSTTFFPEILGKRK